MVTARWQGSWAVCMLLAICLAAGCTPGGNGGNGGDGGTGRVSVQITDKPYPFDLLTSAIITITRVEVRTGDPEDEDEEAFVTIFEGEQEFDLLELQNGRTDLLAEADVPAGTYTQMRLIVTEGLVTLIDGREFPLDVPSGDTSGIKLNFTFEVEEGREAQLLLDVDLSRAFRPVPSGKIEDPSTIREFQFSPSVAMRLIAILEAGSIAGTVTDQEGAAIEAASVTAFENDEEVTSTSTEADGTYVLSGLTTGTYRVEFSATGFQDAQIEGVDVQAGERTEDIDVTLAPE